MQIRLVDALRLVLVLCALQVVSHAQRPEILYLRFSETAGTTTADLALPGLPGIATTLQNGGAFNTNCHPGLTPANLKTANTTVDPCTTNTTFNVTGDWTIEFYIIDTQGTPTGRRYVFGDPSTANGGLQCYRDASINNTRLILEGAGMNPVTINSAVQFATWKRVSITHDSRENTIRTFVNGANNGTFPQPFSIDLVGSNATGLRVGGNGTGNNPWQGRLDEFRVWDRLLTPAEVAAHTGHVDASPDDVAISAIVSPIRDLNCIDLTASTPVTIELENCGSNSLPAGTMIPVDVAINGANVLSDAVTTTVTLNTGEKEILTIPTGVDMTGLTVFNYTVTANLPLDGVAVNDTASRTVITPAVGPINTFPFTEDFEGTTSNLTTLPPQGWGQLLSDSTGTDSDWYFTFQPTATVTTGPTGDHTSGTGYYAFVEDAGDHAAVSMISRCLDFTGTVNPRIKFWMWSENGTPGMNENFLSVDVLTSPGAVVTMNAMPATGDLGPGWNAMVVDLLAFAGQQCRVIFRGTSDGGSDEHDIAIDDIIFFDFIAGVGQAPQPGLAILDINGAESPGLSGVGSFDNGPYTTNVRVGELLNFDFTGEPNQVIILLLGAKNPLAASFTGIGSIDIGGAIDPMSGLPSGISVFADGSVASGFNPFFNTTNAGTSNVFFTMPPVPLGVLTTFQAAMLNTTPNAVGMTNAVEVVVVP